MITSYFKIEILEIRLQMGTLGSKRFSRIFIALFCPGTSLKKTIWPREDLEADMGTLNSGLDVSSFGDA